MRLEIVEGRVARAAWWSIRWTVLAPRRRALRHEFDHVIDHQSTL